MAYDGYGKLIITSSNNDEFVGDAWDGGIGRDDSRS